MNYMLFIHTDELLNAVLVSCLHHCLLLTVMFGCGLGYTDGPMRKVSTTLQTKLDDANFPWAAQGMSLFIGKVYFTRLGVGR